MNQPYYTKTIQKFLAIVAFLFGLATLFAGTRVLTGADPGYVIFKPILIYNTVMGLAYVAAGIIAWRSAYHGKYTAAAIFVLNFLVLSVSYYLYTTGTAIAIDSLRAMILRTVVWLILFIGLAWSFKRQLT